MVADRTVVGAIRGALAEAADPVKASQMQAYMKSAMPFRGATKPVRQQALRPILNSYAPADRAAWEAAIRELWDGASFREERYAATALARHRTAREWRDAQALGLFAHLITTGAWWDHVDEIASHLVGDALMHDRAASTPVIRGWASADDVWLRRTAVICQLRAKDATDLELLGHAIEKNADDTSFWLRKAIGWALREYAKTDPSWVLEEIDRLGDRLSGLSRREATKHLPADPAAT